MATRVKAIETLDELKVMVGRSHGVPLGDVGAWQDAGGLLWAGFYDAASRRPRSFAAVAANGPGAGGFTLWEVEAVAA